MKNLIVMIGCVLLAIACSNQTAPTGAGGGGGSGGGQPPRPRLTIDGEVGNGGHGIVIGEKVYLWDLVEAGIEEKAVVDLRIEKGVNTFAHRLESRITLGMNDDRTLIPFKEIGSKLEQLMTADPVLALSALRTMQMYQWRFVDRDLLTLPLKGEIVKLEEGSAILVANRRGRTIYLSRPAFERMDKVNRAATFFHEAFYALIKPVSVETKGGKETQMQDGTRVRELVAFLFGNTKKYNAIALRGQVDPNEFPRLSDGSGIGGAVLGDFLSYGNYTGYSGNNAIYMVAETNLEFVKNGAGEKTILSPTYVTGSHPGVQKDLEAFCAETLKGGGLYATMGFPKDHFSEGAGGMVLKFANYQEEGEIKTYVQYEWVKTLPPVKENIFGEIPKDREDCVDFIRIVSWDFLIREHNIAYPEDLANEAPAQLKYAMTLNRLHPLGSFKIEDYREFLKK